MDWRTVVNNIGDSYRIKNHLEKKTIKFVHSETIKSVHDYLDIYTNHEGVNKWEATGGLSRISIIDLTIIYSVITVYQGAMLPVRPSGVMWYFGSKYLNRTNSMGSP